MVAAFVGAEFQNSNARRSWPTRLPSGRVRGIPTVHYIAAAESAVGNVVFPRRGALGAQTAKQPTLVQDGERLG